MLVDPQGAPIFLTAAAIKRAKIDEVANGDNELVAAVSGKKICLLSCLLVAKEAVDVTFYSVLEAGLCKSEIAIGYVQDGAIVLNPDKSHRVRFEDGDQVIVIAEDVYSHQGSRDDG